VATNVPGARGGMPPSLGVTPPAQGGGGQLSPDMILKLLQLMGQSPSPEARSDQPDKLKRTEK